MSGDGSPTGSHGTACAGIVAATFNNSAGVAGVAGVCADPARRVRDVERRGDRRRDQLGDHQRRRRHQHELRLGTTCDPLIVDPSIVAADTAGLVMAAATHNYDSGSITYPATHPLVIAVGASDQVDDRKSPASPDGEAWGSNFGPEISVVAPGVLVPDHGPAGRRRLQRRRLRRDVGRGELPELRRRRGRLRDGVRRHVGGDAARRRPRRAAAQRVPGAHQRRGAPASSSARPTRRARRRTSRPPATTAAPGTRTWATAASTSARRWTSPTCMIRDWPGDTGTEPSAPSGGNFWNFADVVVRIFDDDVFVPSDPRSRRTSRSARRTTCTSGCATSVRARPATSTVDARLTPYVGTQFVYPTDWTAVDGTHLAPTPMSRDLRDDPGRRRGDRQVLDLRRAGGGPALGGLAPVRGHLGERRQRLRVRDGRLRREPAWSRGSATSPSGTCR